MQLSNFPSATYWRDCLFSIVSSCLLCHRLGDRKCVGLSLDFQSYSINLNFCFCACTILSGNIIQEIRMSIFITALFTITNTWKQLKCPAEGWKKKMRIYTMEYYSAIKKEWNCALRRDGVGPRNCHIEWSKSERRKQILYSIAYMWNLERWY